ncbi:S8 family peptidase [Roseateles sp. DXS20W]|uniref:S8 family peptidase n=1 Tax=Pelomonas lactea TaxID=3299030 RepID=A0ABW7GRN5_9BURK
MKMTLKPAALAALVLLSGVATSSLAQSRKTYIVQLKDEPAASYQGTVSGYAATQPAPGEAFQAGSTRVQAYLGYLSQRQDEVLSLIDRSRVLATYNTVFNGFSAHLTEAEALTLRNSAAVVDVFEDEPRQLDTITTTKFLGLSAAGGLWSQSVNGSAIKGENLVIGVIDGGVWPENPAFFDRVDANGVPSNNPAHSLAYGPAPASFTGGCVPGPGIRLDHCNNKLVGIKHFNATFKVSGRTLHWTDFPDSGRDSVAGPTGHGSHGDHTASTAAGNDGATAIVNGMQLGVASGMAPRARVASYKVCWTFVNAAATDGTGSQNTCYTSDSVSAIDQAVKDGVNVINFSISGSQTSVNDPVEQAFYRAALANVFVAASAGNDGPGQAVAHISPWISTVAASTHDRAFRGDVTLGNAAKYTGASMAQSPVVAGTALIRAEDAGVGGGNASLCFSDAAAAAGVGQVVLDAAKVSGKVVICTRGNNARVDKSLAVANAGGIGMVMVDNGGGLVAEPHSVPTVHVTAADGALIKSYAVGGAGTAGLSQFYVGTTAAPIMAGFSSRGPNGGDANILKPDLTAPGVDIIAQGTPGLTQAERDQVAANTLVPPPAWTTISGTSMSSPHVAGLALLLRQAKPTWSPAAIKSALMTTGFSTLNDGLAGAQNGLLPWAQGAGHVAPQKAIDPGLVYDAGKADWVRYQCKVNRAAVPASDCTTYGTLDETYNLNLPSITAGGIFSTGVTVTRRVTNVGAAAATYTAAASVPNFTTVVTPSTLTLNPGETKSFTVKLTPGAGAGVNTWYFGDLVWTENGGTHVVRSPVQARRGVPISAPAAVSAITPSGSRTLTVKTGFAGRMSARKGVKDVTMSPAATLVPDRGLDDVGMIEACKAGDDAPDFKVYNFTVPANTMVARFALRQADTSSPIDDNDLVVLGPDGLERYSGAGGTNEAVQLTTPAAGNYRVCVHAWDGRPQMTHALSSWIVGVGDAAGTLNVLTPSQVYAGGSATVGLSWSGLTAGKRYVGAAQWLDNTGTPQATTVVRVEPSVPTITEAGDTVRSKLRARQD